MAIEPTQEQHDALEAILNDHASGWDWEITDNFENAEAAVAAWKSRSEKGNFFRGHQATTALLVWEGYLQVDPEEVIRNQFEE
jgi:hypothetical protein